MAPVQQLPSSWKELIDNGDMKLQNTEPNATAPDAKMEDAIRQQSPSLLSPSMSSSASRPPASTSLGGSDLLPVYCALLGCLIVGLVAWILVKQMLRRGASGQDEKSLTVASSGLPQQPLQQQQQLQQQQPLMLQFPRAGCRRPKRRSADSGFGGSELAPEEDLSVDAVIHCRRLLRELSDSRLQRLENILANDADPDGWRRLAHELGLTSEELLELESHSVCGGNQPAIRQMLRTWSRRPSSSVGHLARCLRRVGRSDALILFRESPLTSASGKAGGHQRVQRMHRRQRERPDELEEALQQPQQQPLHQDEAQRSFEQRRCSRFGTEEADDPLNASKQLEEPQKAEEQETEAHSSELETAVLNLD